MGLNYVGPLIGCFSTNTCTVFNLWLEVCGCRELTVCIDLRHFIADLCEYPWILVSVGGSGTNPPWIPRIVKFWRSQRYTQIFNCTGVSAPNSQVVQGSTVQLSEQHRTNQELHSSTPQSILDHSG